MRSFAGALAAIIVVIGGSLVPAAAASQPSTTLNDVVASATPGTPIRVQGTVRATTDIDLVGLDLIIAGELIVPADIRVNLYGTTLRINNDRTRANAVRRLRDLASGTPDAAHAFEALANADILVLGELNLSRLADYEGPLPTPSGDAPSRIQADVPGLPTIGATRDFALTVWDGGMLRVSGSEIRHASVFAAAAGVQVVEASTLDGLGGLIGYRSAVVVDQSTVSGSGTLVSSGGTLDLLAATVATTQVQLFDSPYLPITAPAPIDGLAAPIQSVPQPAAGTITGSALSASGVWIENSDLHMDTTTVNGGSIYASWQQTEHTPSRLVLINNALEESHIDVNADYGASVGELDVSGNVLRDGYGISVSVHPSAFFDRFAIEGNVIERGSSGISLHTWCCNPENDSLLSVIGNTIDSVGGYGLHASHIDATFAGNVVRNSGYGLWLDHSTSVLEGNTLDDNGVGISIPYDSKHTLATASANVVNGLNIDGTLRPGEQVYFFDEPSVTVTGRTSNGNHPAHAGALTQQGLITVYDSQNITISDCDLSENTNGIVLVGASASVTACHIHDMADTGLAAEASSPVISNSSFATNPSGISITGADAVSRPKVHDTAVTGGVTGLFVQGNSPEILRLSVTQADCYGIRASSAGVTLTDSTLSGSRSGSWPCESWRDFAAGGFVADNTSGTIQGTTFADNTSGIRLVGASPHFTSSMFEGNDTGIWLSNASPSIIDSLVRNNAETGVHATSGSSPDLSRNQIVANAGPGILADFSSPQVLCNRIGSNGGDGIHLSSFSSGGSQPTVNDNDITDNIGHGLRNEQQSTINAERNWWGSSSGPGGNGQGSGDEVSSFVAYTPWLSAPSSCT